MFEYLISQSLLRDFITLFVVVDPIGTLPVFYYATQTAPERLHARIALRAVLVATLVLLGFLVLGQVLLESLGLRLGAFQVAGGVVLMLFALSMIFGAPKSSQEIAEAESDHMSGAVFPLAMPSIASPGAMLAIVVLTDNHSNSVSEQAMTGFVLLIVMGITLALLLLAPYLKRVIGATGANVISRIMGIVLATIAVDAMIGGLEMMGVLTLGG